MKKYIILFTCKVFLFANQIDTLMHINNLPTPQQKQDIKMPTSTYEPLVTNGFLDTQPLSILLRLMSQNEWDEAKKVADLLRNQEPNNLDILFLSGQIYERFFKYKQAANFYRSMLDIDNTLQRPRFELAKVLFLRGDFEASKHHFLLNISQGLPKNVELVVKKYLQQMEKQKLSFDFSFAIIPSSNINQGTTKSTVLIDDKVYTLSSSTHAKSGVGLQSFLGGTYRFGDDLKYFVNSSLTHSDFASFENDNSYLNASFGKIYLSDKSKFSIQSGVHYMHYLKKKLYHGFNVLAQYEYQIGKNTRIFNSYEFTKNYYINVYKYLNSNNFKLNLSILHVHGGNLVINSSVNFSKLMAKDKSYSYKDYTFIFDIVKHFEYKNLSLGTFLQAKDKKYESKAVFFNKIRQDYLYTFGINALKRDFNVFGFAPKFVLNYTKNNSNIPIYQYNSTNFYLQFTKSF